MTRDKQLLDAAATAYPEDPCCAEVFIQGAEWADLHPTMPRFAALNIHEDTAKELLQTLRECIGVAEYSHRTSIDRWSYREGVLATKVIFHEILKEMVPKDREFWQKYVDQHIEQLCKNRGL